MFADQTATFQVDGEMEEKEETHQHSGNGTFFSAVIQPHGPYNGHYNNGV